MMGSEKKDNPIVKTGVETVTIGYWLERVLNRMEPIFQAFNLI